MSRSRAVVTGGAGFIGSHLVDRLVDDDWAVLVVDDLSKGRLERLADARRLGDVHFHQLDIVGPELVEAVRRFSPSAVFHLAAQSGVRPSVEDPLFDARVNILGTINVLVAAAQAGAERVVFASSGGAIYGEIDGPPAGEDYPRRPDSPYGISKKVVEDYFRYFHLAHGLDYVLLALANVYGPRQDPYGEAGVVAIFSRMMIDGGLPVVYGDGSQVRDYVFVEDVVDAFVRAAELGGPGRYNIGTGRETSVTDLCKALAGITGHKGSPRYAPAKPGDLQRSVVDPAAARSHLGWEAWTPLAEGLARTVEWFRAHR